MRSDGPLSSKKQNERFPIEQTFPYRNQQAFPTSNSSLFIKKPPTNQDQRFELALVTMSEQQAHVFVLLCLLLFCLCVWVCLCVCVCVFCFVYCLFSFVLVGWLASCSEVRDMLLRDQIHLRSVQLVCIDS